MPGDITGVNHTSFTVSDREPTMAYFTCVQGSVAPDISARDPRLNQT
jgi:hypothetical protein